MKYVLAIILCVSFLQVSSQGRMGRVTDRFRGGGSGGGAGSDTLGRRNKMEDSITINYRYLDTTRNFKLDSSINDFSLRYPIPANHYYLGNLGNATQSYLFSPIMRAGWDPGFHAYDVYKTTIERARFFSTTRPYSEINYLISSRAGQMIELMHTQNVKPNWNVHFQYKFINSPGVFMNQKTNHNNYTITNWYQSVNKRYNNYFILAANKLQGSENGGILNDANYLDDSRFSDRLYIPTKLGDSNPYGLNFFNTTVNSGNKYSDLNLVMRQQYDLGRKDSLVTDSTVIPLFFPRLRLEHTITYTKSSYLYIDKSVNVANYKSFFDIDIPNSVSEYQLNDKWKRIVNDFSVYTFPDEKNTQQFIKLGASMENLSGSFDTLVLNKKYVNIFGHGEYRNRTRNQKWDLMASGLMYFAGRNLGDYEARASIQSLLGRKIGSLQLGFENVNRKPGFITDTLSAFYLMKDYKEFKKENTTHIYATIYQPLLKLGLTGHYYLATNYVYFSKNYQINQASSLFNVLQVAANKVFEAGKTKQWKWRSEVYFQQTIGSSPVNLPMIFTRNRFGYEGNLGYNRLNIAMGFDTKYATPYKANGYSPMLGQFLYQDSVTVKNSIPEIAAYIHFRISSFKAFIRAENLNSFSKLGGVWGFYNNGMAVPDYPYPGLMIRVGIFWGFVN